MRYSVIIVLIILFLGCESEKIEYHCNAPLSDAEVSDIIFDGTDVESIDATKLSSNINTEDTILPDSTDYGVILSDVLSKDAGYQDVISGKLCNVVGVSKECEVDESCYPFVECAGLCRKCGSLTAGSNCEIHSDCKCGMACLALSDRQLKCYKVCNNNSDCPSGQTCTDGWSAEYQHEYYKICKMATPQNKEEGK